jgi:mannosyltransferase
MNKKTRLILLFAVLSLGILLRIYNIRAWDFWFDEVISIRAAHNDISNDIQPPLYHSILYLFLIFVVENEFNVRILSALFGILSIYMIYRIGKQLFNYRVGLISAFILSVSPIHIWYAQEARGYTLFVFLAIATFYCFILSLRKNRNKQWLQYGVFATLSIYASYYLFLIVIAELAVLLHGRYIAQAKKWILTRLLSAGLFCFWLPVFYNHIISTNTIFWLKKPSIRSLIITFENFNVGYSATQAAYLFSSITFLLLVANSVRVLKKYRADFFLLLAFIVLPVSAVYLISQMMPVYLDRQLMIFSPFYYLMLAVGIENFNSRRTKIFFIVTISLLSSISLHRYFNSEISPPYHHEGVHLKKPLRPAAQYLKDNIMPGDIVAHTNPSTQALGYYYSNRGITDYLIFKPNSLDHYFMNSIQKDKAGAWHIIDLSCGIEQYNLSRIWLVTSSWERDGRIDENSIAVKNYLERHYTKIKSEYFDGIYLELYAMDIK